MQLLKGEDAGIYFIDSSKLQICHNKRTSSYGSFIGFKLHMIINDKGEIMAVKITKGNRSDILPVANLAFGLTGKIYGDKGYISSN
ncbi:MAG: transposase, partial [Rickettsiaceae bacterium]